MGIQRTEERLGAFSLFRHLGRLLGFIAGKKKLLLLFALLSVLQAGLELALPQIVRQAIDAHIMPAWARVDPAGRDELQGLAADRIQPAADRAHLFIRWTDLDASRQRALRARGLLDAEGWHRLEPQGRFIPDSAFGRLPAAERERIRAPDRRGVARLAALYGALLLFGFFLAYAVTYGLNHLGQSAVLRVRQSLWRHLLRLPMRYFDQNPVGRLVTRVANDPANLSELFSAVLATALADVVLFVGVLALLFRMDAVTTAWLLLIAPAVFGLTWWFKRASQKIYRLVRVQLARLNTTIQESYSGLQVIRSFVHEKLSSARFEDMNREYYRTQVRLVHVFSVFRPAIDVFGTLALALVIWIGGQRILDLQMSLGTLVAFLLYLRMVFRPLQSLAEKFNILQSSVISSERLLRVFDTAPEPSGTERAPAGQPVDISFESVDFGYEPDLPVLHGVSFHVAPGEKVALVGPSGSGKSTIISLLLGFYRLQPDQGRIRVAGLDTGRWDARDLRRNFALVQQDLFLFAGDLRRNVCLWNPPDEERLDRALRVSRLGLVTDRLAQGLSHPLNERGTVLSQGERQLVSLARALACGGPLLVLDEATSSVDSATEAWIQEALGELLQDRTALLIAHRLSTIQSADRILVLSSGRIVEQGRHEELMAKDGLYARLYRTQLSPDAPERS